jgi:hypothetical protein
MPASLRFWNPQLKMIKLEMVILKGMRKRLVQLTVHLLQMIEDLQLGVGLTVQKAKEWVA